MRTVANVPNLQPAAPGGIANSEMLAAAATDRTPLQQCRTFARRRGSCDVVASAIGLDRSEILLELLPGDVAGMGDGNTGEPITALALSKHLFAVDSPPIVSPAIDISARIARIVQRSERGRYGQRLENRHLLVADPRREADALLAEGLDRLRGGPDARERLEKIGDRLSDLLVGVEDHLAGLVIGEPRRQRAAIFAAPHLVQDAAAQPRFDDVQLGLAHRPLEAEQKPVVEAGRIVHAVLIENQRIGEGADLQQAMPVGMVSSRAGSGNQHAHPSPHASVEKDDQPAMRVRGQRFTQHGRAQPLVSGNSRRLRGRTGDSPGHLVVFFAPIARSIVLGWTSRPSSFWTNTLLEFCGLVGTLIVDEDGVYDPTSPNDRLLLGMKGTMSEMELSVFRRRSIEAMKQKAKRASSS